MQTLWDYSYNRDVLINYFYKIMSYISIMLMFARLIQVITDIKWIHYRSILTS